MIVADLPLTLWLENYCRCDRKISENAQIDPLIAVKTNRSAEGLFARIFPHRLNAIHCFWHIENNLCRCEAFYHSTPRGTTCPCMSVVPLL